MSLAEEHPTISAVRDRVATAPPRLTKAWLRQLCLDAGADDVGFVSVDRAELAGERPHILNALPGTQTLISIVTRLHRENIRTPARSVGNLEFHRSYHHINDVAHTVAAAVSQQESATQEIARNVSQASTGTDQVTTNIAGVAGAAAQTGQAAHKVLDSATELSRQSDHLGGELARFLESVRAA